MEWYHSRLLSCFEVRKINTPFPIKQNILLLYVIKLYALIKYKFCLENGFENVHGRD